MKAEKEKKVSRNVCKSKNSRYDWMDSEGNIIESFKTKNEAIERTVVTGGGIKMEKMRSTEDAKLVDGTRLKQVFFEKRILKIGNDSGEFIKTFDSVRKAAEDIVREGKASNADVATLVICMVF